MSSVVVSWLEGPYGVVRVDNEVRGIDIVSFQHHFEHLRLVHGTLLHKLNNFILNCDLVIDVMV